MESGIATRVRRGLELPYSYERMLCALTSQDMTYQGIGPRETATFEAETAQGAVANPQTPQWARHSGTPGTHNTLASGSHHSAHIRRTSSSSSSDMDMDMDMGPELAFYERCSQLGSDCDC